MKTPSNNKSSNARSSIPSSNTKKKGKRAVFGRALNNKSPSPENFRVRKCAKFIPPSPPRASVRSLCQTKDKPTCLLFGPHMETLYNHFGICSNCKLYEDAIHSGEYSKI